MTRHDEIAIPGHLLDITGAPYGADPTGRTDSTAAIVAAIDDVLKRTLDDVAATLARIDALPGENALLGTSCENRKQRGESICIFPETLPFAPTIYFPAGEYLVSDTLTYTLENLQNSKGSELSWQLRFRGAGPGRSVLRLRDHAEGFDGDTPKPVVRFMRRERSNVCMSNYFEDLGIHTGRGNPSAIGLDFYANNTGAVRNVAIESGDGSGFAGLLLGHANYSGVLVSKVSTRGFDYGCHFDSATHTMFFAAENVTIRDPRRAGIYVGAISASLRGIDYSGAAPGVVCDAVAGLTVLVDSELDGSGPFAVEHKSGVLVMDNVRTSGFGCAVRSKAGDIGEASGVVSDLVLPRRCDGLDASTTARLPVEETPVYAIRPGGRAVGVREFGAVGDGVQDDTAAIQDALDSGAREIHFEPGRYVLCRPLSIPGGVDRVNFHFCDLVAGLPLREMKGEGAFRVTGESEHPLLIEDILAWEEWRGDHVMIDHASTRALVLSDLHTQTLSLYRNSVPGGRVFLENVATTAGVVPGATGHGRICAVFRGQKVWARQFNPERGEPMVLNDGGDLWVLGFKSEDEGVAFHTINGGRTEVLGGVLNGGAAEAVAFVSENSAIRVSAVSNGWERKRFFGTSVKEIRADAVAATVLNAECISRGIPEDRGPQITVSLYTSGKLKG